MCVQAENGRLLSTTAAASKPKRNACTLRGNSFTQAPKFPASSQNYKDHNKHRLQIEPADSEELAHLYSSSDCRNKKLPSIKTENTNMIISIRAKINFHTYITKNRTSGSRFLNSCRCLQLSRYPDRLLLLRPSWNRR